MYYTKFCKCSQLIGGLLKGSKRGFGFGVFECPAGGAGGGVTGDDFVPDGVGDFGSGGAAGLGFNKGAGTEVTGAAGSVAGEGVVETDAGAGDSGADVDAITGIVVDKIVFENIVGDGSAA